MEEKSGIIHVIFFMLGVVLVSLGVFLFATPEKEKKGLIDVEDNKNEDKTETNNLIKEIDFGDFDSTKIEKLKSGKEVEVSVSYVDDKTHIFYDDEEMLSIDIDLLNKYFIYNDLFIVFSYDFGNTGTIYTIDSNKKVTTIKELDMNNSVMAPVSLSIDNDKLIVVGLRVINNYLILEDNEIDICDEDLLQENNIQSDLPVKIEYYFNIINNKSVFDFIKVDDTIESVKEITCQSVE